MKRLSKIFIIGLLSLVWCHTALAQDTDKYLLGEERQLQIKVFVLGEIAKPGEYVVSDNTDLIELISKAGGTTEFSRLGSVTITRKRSSYDNNSPIARVDKEIIRFDMNDYLNNLQNTNPPILKPGDVIFIRRNNWFKWRSAFTVIRDISVVASAYFLYVRAYK